MEGILSTREIKEAYGLRYPGWSLLGRPEGLLFFDRDYLAYPVLDGIPCPQISHGVLANHFGKPVRI